MSEGKGINVEYLPLDKLRPDPFNPRTISQEQLRALERSIEEFGFVDPIIVRRQDLTVIGGHQRLAAARRLGLNEVPVVQLELSPDQARLLNLGLNRIRGDWDEALLTRVLQHLDAEEQDLSLSGFEENKSPSFCGRSTETRSAVASRPSISMPLFLRRRAADV